LYFVWGITMAAFSGSTMDQTNREKLDQAIQQELEV
jgi:hypothetical protein